MAETKTKVRNIGIPNVEPPEKTCDDIQCPFHGNLSVRGRVMEGISESYQKVCSIRKTQIEETSTSSTLHRCQSR